MNGRDEELLSAYLDGELTDDERSRVEQWLADDLSAREALDELAEVSAWVRGLPRPAAPVDVHNAVLVRVRPLNAPASARSAPRGPMWRRRAAWLGSSAALLLVAFTLFLARPVFRTIGPADVPREMSVADVESLGVPAETAGGGPQAVEADGVALATPAAPARTALGMDVTLSESEAFARTPQHAALAAFVNSDLIQNEFQNEFRELVERGESPAPGDVLANVSQVGDQVVVTHYRVVDTQNVLGQIQVILTKNGIEALSPAAAEEVRTGAEGGEIASNDRLQAIYVEAPSENFQSAVDAIAGLENVTGVTTNTVLVEELDESRDLASLAENVVDGASQLRAIPEQVTEPNAAVADFDAGAHVNGVAELPLSAAESADQPKPPALAEFGLARVDTPPPPPQSSRSKEFADALDANTIGYQVIVPARSELLAELQQQSQTLLFAQAPAAEAPVDGRFSKQAKRRAWNFAAPSAENRPVGTDRIRAVILLVPQQSPQ